VPTKRQFDLVLIMLVLFAPAKGLAKMWAARHAASSEGETQTVAKAANVIL
jgi:hypothetical protein